MRSSSKFDLSGGGQCRGSKETLGRLTGCQSTEEEKEDQEERQEERGTEEKVGASRGAASLQHHHFTGQLLC